MFNIFILEDDRTQRISLEKKIRQLSDEMELTKLNIESFSNVAEIKALHPLPSPDNIYFLDLEIDGNKQAGLELGKYIRESDPYASIIFLTVHENFLHTTYQYRIEALDFIAKGDDASIYDSLKIDLKRIIQKKLHWTAEKNIVTLKTSSGFVNIPMSKICYFESNKLNSHSAFVYTVDNECYQVNSNITKIKKAYPIFINSHRSYLVNPYSIKQVNISEYYILFSKNLRCPLARTQRKKFLNQLSKLTLNIKIN